MDISFHYFAIKTLSYLAGFNEEDSQTIAVYSQMVDDFDYTAYWDCVNIPDYIRNNADYDLITTFGFFNPAQTGFLCDGLLGKLDYLNLLLTRFQRNTDTPFHFPYNSRDAIGHKDYRVRPASMDIDSPIVGMIRAREDLLGQGHRPNPFGNLYYRKCLIKIGMLLHIFADTVAHQMFSGFASDVNNIEIINVVNNITGVDETGKYKTLLQKFLRLLKSWAPDATPTIGHMMAEHIPDLTHLSFTMKYDDAIYTRSNTAEFTAHCRKIFNYLLSCRNLEPCSDNEWQGYAERLRHSFLTDISGAESEQEMVEMLKEAWSPFRLHYDYNSKEIKDSFILKSTPKEGELRMINGEPEPNVNTEASDDFYLFNVCAEEVLIDLYGSKPRG